MRSVNLSQYLSFVCSRLSTGGLSAGRAFAAAAALCAVLAGCTSTLTTDNLTTDLGDADVDLSTSVIKTCEGCTAGQVCVEGACVNVPTKCPCPKETYCDLASNLCKVGCTVDGECASGRICNDASRSCQVGCRKDEACTTGQICDSTLCRTGCRKDTECGSGMICALPAYKCVAGCRKDLDCGGAKICDTATNTCQTGCRRDADCTTAGQICDSATLMCRPGCRANAGCPSEQICDTVNSKCIAGCDTDARCNSGHICDKALCVTGCRTSATCALNTYCDTTTTKTCLPGCNADKTRCAVGEACVRFVDGTYKCQAACAGWDCNGTGWACFEQGSDYRGAHCRQTCSSDGDCSGGMRCTWFTRDATVPGMYSVRYCALPCTTAGCTTCVDSYGMAGTGMCNTATKGCTNGMYTCYQTSPLYGL